MKGGQNRNSTIPDKLAVVMDPRGAGAGPSGWRRGRPGGPQIVGRFGTERSTASATRDLHQVIGPENGLERPGEVTGLHRFSHLARAGAYNTAGRGWRPGGNLFIHVVPGKEPGSKIGPGTIRYEAFRGAVTAPGSAEGHNFTHRAYTMGRTTLP